MSGEQLQFRRAAREDGCDKEQAAIVKKIVPSEEMAPKEALPKRKKDTKMGVVAKISPSTGPTTSDGD